MQPNTPRSDSFEFYFPHSDTLVQVETSEDDVTIRATRETFSESRKEYFIHELASEGFIPDQYRWYSNGARGVRWILDRSWVKIDPALTAQTQRWMVTLLLSSCGFWLLLMAAVVVYHP